MTQNEIDTFEDSLNKIKTEFDSIETFIETDGSKSERFKSYLKKLYDYLKINEDVLNELTTSSNVNKFESLPQLIVDKQLVDNEQIYQQLQLYNNDTSSSIQSLTKFFSKCLVSIDSISFNVELKKTLTNKNEQTNGNGTTTDNLEDDDSNDGEDEEDDDLASDDESILSDDSIANMLKNSKIKTDIKNKEKKLSVSNGKNKQVEFGIPDGSDSEISDFEVNPNDKDDAEDDEDEEEEENDLGEEGEDDDEDELNLDEKEDDIDSDEVDEDLVDLYTDLGDEKEVMGIGKPSKSFNKVDFDREDFGLNDDDDEDEENEKEEFDNDVDETEKEIIKQQPNKSRDLFDDGTQEEKEITENKSSFEIRQSKLKEQVEDIHKTMLGELTDKPWQLTGEATSKSRPKESLLEEFLEFDHTTRKAPINSAQTTEQLEAIIKQRVKDKAFDDVERKVKPVDMQYEFKKQIALDHDKSKLGLGEVYEQEYLKQQNGTDDKSKDKVNPKHEEIRKQMQSLFIKLDALSNFHYTPKAPAPEIKVISNMPSITMEEVAPVSVADTNILAPEEIKKNINSLPKSKSEEDKKDKKKNLRSKKLLGKKKKSEKEHILKIKQALNPDDPKLAKKLAMEKLVKQSKNKSKNIKILKQEKKTKVNTAYRSSHAFFTQLQETNQIGSKVAKKRSNDATDKTKLTSKKLKL